MGSILTCINFGAGMSSVRVVTQPNKQVRQADDNDRSPAASLPHGMMQATLGDWVECVVQHRVQ